MLFFFSFEKNMFVACFKTYADFVLSIRIDDNFFLVLVFAEMDKMISSSGARF